MPAMMRKPLFGRQFARFLAVGCLNTLIGLGVVYALLHLAGFSYWGATFTGNAVGAVVSYGLNRNFTFGSRAAVPRTFAIFVLVILVCYWLSFYAGLRIADFVTAIVPNASQALVKDVAVVISTGIYAIVNYFGQKYFVFREKEKPHASEA